MLGGSICAVIGCGNLNRSDDGIGVIVVQRLIVVDACLSGSQPGSIFKLPGEEVAKRPDPGYGLHDFRWDHALYAGRKIFGDAFPRDVTVYLVEAANVSLGFELSQAVSEAVDRVVASLKDEIRERASRLRQEFSHAQAGYTQAPASQGLSRIEIRGGSIYVEAGLYATYFSGLESIILFKQEEKLLLLPVRHTAAGGLLLKVRNPHGDRVVHAQEFLRDQGIDEHQEWVLPVQWDSRSAALVADWPIRQ